MQKRKLIHKCKAMSGKQILKALKITKKMYDEVVRTYIKEKD